MSEPTPADRPCVVAGFDGSAASRAAVSLAVRRVRGGGRLVVIHAFNPPSDRYGQPNAQHLLDAGLARARESIDRLSEEVPGLGSVQWSSEIVAGPAADAIVRVAEAEHADEIVVGTRGAGRARALLGSVAHDVLHRARCPVVVIPERALATSAAAVRRDDVEALA